MIDFVQARDDFNEEKWVRMVGRADRQSARQRTPRLDSNSCYASKLGKPTGRKPPTSQPGTQNMENFACELWPENARAKFGTRALFIEHEKSSDA